MLNPKPVPEPSRDLISKALDLLTVLGSNNSELIDGIKEMKEVQKHNEQVLTEAKETAGAANKAVIRMKNDMAELKHKKEKYVNLVNETDAALDSKKKDFETYMSSKEAAFNSTKHLLLEREDKVSTREQKCLEQERYADTMEQTFENRQIKLDDREQKIQEKEKELKETFAKLKNLIPNG